jgi:hypothetical protein
LQFAEICLPAIIGSGWSLTRHHRRFDENRSGARPFRRSNVSKNKTKRLKSL